MIEAQLEGAFDKLIKQIIKEIQITKHNKKRFSGPRIKKKRDVNNGIPCPGKQPLGETGTKIPIQD